MIIEPHKFREAFVSVFGLRNGWIPSQSKISPHGTLKSTLWIASIGVLSFFYFCAFFTPVHLHDSAHFAIAGVNMVRDHAGLYYPYSPLDSNGMGPAYDYLQNGTIHYGMRIDYPAKMYSAVFGTVCAMMGQVRFEYAQWISLIALVLSNTVLYLILRRFFTGIILSCIILSILFLPVMRFLMNPGTDVFGYLGCLLTIWAAFNLRLRDFYVGLVAGALTHGRGQMMSILLVYPLIALRKRDGESRWLRLLALITGFASSYGLLGYLFAQMAGYTSSNGPEKFYVKYFSESLRGFSEIGAVWEKLMVSVFSLFQGNQLFYFGFACIAVLVLSLNSFSKRLVVGAIAFVMPPIILYSFDKYAPPAARYYMFAVPLIALAAHLSIKNAVSCKRQIGFALVTVFLSLLAWFSTYGWGWAFFDGQHIASRARYFDFPNAEEGLKKYFSSDDVVLINHSLPTALVRLDKIVLLPSFEAFAKGNNRMVDGIIITYSPNPPNEFFTPKDWMRNSEFPVEFLDNAGTKFTRVYEGKSEILNKTGYVMARSFLLAYKRAGSPASH